MKSRSRALFCIALAAVTAAMTGMIAGCKRSQPDATTAAGQPNTKTYRLRGKVVSAHAASGTVTIDSDAIPGFMAAMTMDYKLKNPTIISELHPGDHLNADLLVSDDATLLDSIVVTAQEKPDYMPPIFYHVPQPGDRVPDFKLINQSGKSISLDQYRGKALLITFIYTRCPLADYCPRMGRNFATIESALADSPPLYAKTHLLSISFDPDNDTAAVLKSYGGGTTGKFTKETFSHWEFAAPAKSDLMELAKFFDVGITPEKNHTLTHSLSTTLITPNGEVFRFYPTNDWNPDDVLQAMKQVVAGKS